MAQHREVGRARRPEDGGAGGGQCWILPGLIGLVLAWGYLFAVFALRERFFGIEVREGHWAALTVGASLVTALLTYVLIVRGRLSLAALRGPILALWVSLLCLVTLDVAYSAVLHAMSRDTAIAALAEFDPHSAIGEAYPRLYFPTAKNFRLHKPDYHLTVTTFGGLYSPAMLRSPTLANDVLQAHQVTIDINREGLREQIPFSAAHIYALGDSFTFGWGLDAGQSWVKLLQKRIGCPVYNLGVHDASPKQEFELLAYLLRTYPDAIRIERLIWTIYEGNDLEDSYAEASPRKTGAPRRWLPRDTVLEPLAALPDRLKDGAILTRLLHGQIRFGLKALAGPDGHYEVDGVTLGHPLYRSSKFGPKLFYRPYLERLNAPASYVMDHPNRPALDRVFEDMRELAARHGFQVTVVLVPTDGRLQGRFFDDFPPVVEPPHFLDYVAGLARRMGFTTSTSTGWSSPTPASACFTSGTTTTGMRPAALGRRI